MAFGTIFLSWALMSGVLVAAAPAETRPYAIDWCGVEKPCGSKDRFIEPCVRGSPCNAYFYDCDFGKVTIQCKLICDNPYATYTTVNATADDNLNKAAAGSDAATTTASPPPTITDSPTPSTVAPQAEEQNDDTKTETKESMAKLSTGGGVVTSSSLAMVIATSVVCIFAFDVFRHSL